MLRDSPVLEFSLPVSRTHARMVAALPKNLTAGAHDALLTPEREVLIRTPLKELLPQLDASFWQIHRGTVVNADCIESVTRDEAGKLWLHLRGQPERLVVSRLYAYLFKAM